MGEEADADWQAGLIEWGQENAESEPDDPRRDCPWKCRLGDRGCVCMREASKKQRK